VAEIGTIEACVMLYATVMHAPGLRTITKDETMSSVNDAQKGTMITMAPSTISPAGTVLWKEDAMKGQGIKAFSRDLKKVCWPLNFKPSGIKKYDGSTNPADWLEVYHLSIEAVEGDLYIMANYLPACLSLSSRTWLLGLPTGSVHS
jgi:hypothetical protein